MSKSIEQHFIDWEGNTFGFGYGTGEEHTLGALKQFLALCHQGPHQGSYNFQELEASITPTAAWLLINILAHDDKIEYGTSPRYGWLTKSGKALAEFVSGRSVEQLYELTMHDESYIPCYPSHCNCDDGRDCRGSNPFWAIRS